MRTAFGTAALVVLCSWHASSASAEVLVRWDRDRIPSPAALGIQTIVVPAQNPTLVRHAVLQGFRVLLEIDSASLPAFKPHTRGVAGIVVNGSAPAGQLAALARTLTSPGARVLTADLPGTWPHIRTSWVTKRGEVLHVTSRSAQPWIETNAARIRIAASSPGDGNRLLTYTWQPLTPAAGDSAPALENYLVAIAEAGTFGGSLLLPLHAEFQQRLLLGEPGARAEWSEIRRHIDFYAWGPTHGYRPVASIAVVTSNPGAWEEVMDLLLRHNLPFELLRSTELAERELSGFSLLLVLDEPGSAQRNTLAQFARKGGTVVVDRRGGGTTRTLMWEGAEVATRGEERVGYTLGSGRVVEVLNGVPDPNAFALEVRRLLGREDRAIDIWNGITVLSAPYQSAEGESALVTAINYAHQPLPLQVRVRGLYGVVQYESPEEPVMLLPHRHRDGHTEFVLPALRIGGRVFLSDRRP